MFFPLAILACGLCFLFSKIKNSRISLPIVQASLSKIEEKFKTLKELMNDDSTYFRFSKFEFLNKELDKQIAEVQSLKNVFLQKQIKDLLSEMLFFKENAFSLREKINERFFKEEKERARHIFTDKNGKELLTDEQLKAVLSDDDRNLIIAGAGSGKTRVIDFKVRYLVKHKKVSPKKILLLSFSRKSASDLIKKISENIPEVEARTIHSFGAQVIGRHDKKLLDDSKKELELLVIKALAQTLKDKDTFRVFNLFYGKFFSSVKPLIFYKNLDDLREDLKKLNSRLINVRDDFGEVKAKRALKTLRGEYVRSIDERYIADYLYLQNIEYEYEKKYPYADNYFPDFYLSDYDVYLEHFAITNSGNPPAYFDNPQKYMEGIEWKRNLHEEKKTKMIESFSFLLNAGETSSYLSELFRENGIEVNDSFENDEVYKKICREFCRVFTKFYNSYKLSGLSIRELKQKFVEDRYSLFLKIFESFLSHLEEMIEKENRMDFNDMIIGAIDKYENDDVRDFDYIIVDEFQDTSNLAMKLLDRVYMNSSTAAFLSVGDDWQSIYGFNGSDVTILSEYSKRYSGVLVQNLNNNFRSHSTIVELGRNFVSKNPAQIKKNVVSKNTHLKTAEVDFLSFDKMEEKIASIPDGESIFILYRYNDDCPAGAGIFKEFFELNKNKKPIRKPDCKKNISMMTIHGSKGLEAQHVFVLFPDGVKRRFPSEIEDHFVFNMLKANSDDYPFSEERRLMYVAITRAEQSLYFVSSNKDPNSVFWDELKKITNR